VGDFTVEFWFNANTVATAVQALVTKTINALPNVGTFAMCLSTSSATVWISSNGTTWDLANAVVYKTGVTVGVWNHVALVRNGSTFTAYFNGVGIVVANSANVLYNPATPMLVGCVNSSALANFFNGSIDNLRITKGVARYTGTFAVPSAAFSTY
jgi:hypothetical protein